MPRSEPERGPEQNMREHKSDAQKVKANDKAYDGALHNLPDKHYDPWLGMR